MAIGAKALEVVCDGYMPRLHLRNMRATMMNFDTSGSRVFSVPLYWIEPTVFTKKPSVL